MTITNFNYEGSYLPGLICNIVVKANLGRSPCRSTPQNASGIYIMGCILQPFWILQEKVGISSHLWIIRIVLSQLALYSHVRCNPSTPPDSPKHPQMTITNFNYEGSYLPGLICDIVVKADLGRSASRSTPHPPPNASWDIYYWIYLAAIWILEEKVGISFYFWIIRSVNSTVSIVVMCDVTPLTALKHPPHDSYKFQLWGLIFARCNM